MHQGGQVGGGIVEGPVTLLNQSGVLLQWRDVLEENGQSAFALAGNAFGAQLLDKRLQAGMVKALSQCMIKLHAQPLVNSVELDARQRDHLMPDAEVFLVASLESDQFLPGGLKRGGVGFAFGADLLVKAFHLGDGVGLERRGVQLTFPSDQQHPELRAPVAQVVVGDNPVAQQTERAGQTIPQDGGADVADVHGFGHVGRAEIHHHGPRMRGGFAEKVFPARGTLKGLGQRGRFEAEVQETRAGDLHRGASIGDIQFGDHVRGQLARIQFPGFGERH